MPEAEIIYQQIILYTKRRKSLVSNGKRRELRATLIRTRFEHLIYLVKKKGIKLLERFVIEAISI